MRGRRKFNALSSHVHLLKPNSSQLITHKQEVHMLNRLPVRLLMVVSGVLVLTFSSFGQARWSVGGNMGISIYDGAAGLHIGPMSEVILGKEFALGSEFNINTQGGTPLQWFTYGKYYFSIAGSKIRPYANLGLSLYFYTGGPYFGIQAGGGANIPVANKLYVSPEIQLGPVFGTGGGVGYYDYFGNYYGGGKSSTIFAVIIRGGIRYEI